MQAERWPTFGNMPDLDERMRARATDARVARLATVRPDGAPHVVPVTFALDGAVFVTAVDHKPKSTRALQRLRNIEREPRVSVLIDEYAEDWSRLWWVRGDGHAEVLAASDAIAQIDLLVDRYPAYRERRPEGPAIVVRVDRWSSWSA